MTSKKCTEIHTMRQLNKTERAIGIETFDSVHLPKPIEFSII